MAWRYRDKETKQFVSVSTYNRSRSHGGTKYERISDLRWHSPKAEAQPIRKTIGDRIAEALEKGEAPPKAGKIKTLAEYRKYYQYYEEYEEQPEIETGVDY